MRWTRVLTVMLIALLACGSAVHATTIEMKEFTCPVDARQFRGGVLLSTNSFGGVDSDFCSWPRGSSPMPYEVQVCPDCFYAVQNEFFGEALPKETKEKLTTVLEKWRKDHPEVTKVEDLSYGQRWELAALCFVVKAGDHPRYAGNLWLRAAYAERHYALREANFAFGDPMSAFEVVDDIEAGLAGEKDIPKAVDGTFRLAMGAHRAGDVKRRDATLKKLDEMKLDETQRTRLADLKASFAREALYQQRAVDAFNKALEAEDVKPEQTHIYLFLVADMTRRLGRSVEAVKLFKKVKESGKVREDIGRMCDFLVNWLEAE